MLKKLDNQWQRQEHFRHYRDNVRCTYSLTVQIEITKLQSALKANGIRAYPSQIYLLATAVNRFPEFRMGVTGKGEPGYWEVSHPSYTVFNHDTKTFSSIWTPYDNNFFTFYRACTDDMERYAHTTSFAPKPNEPENSFSVSSVPWVDFTAFNLNIYSDGTYLAPIFTIGKYGKRDNQIWMPLAMQLHHAACDGYHAGQFVEALQTMAQEYDDWLYKGRHI